MSVERYRRSVFLRVAIFHDYLCSLGGGEKTILCLAKALDADLVTNDFNREVLRLADAEDVRVTDLGPLSEIPPFRQIHASMRFMAVRLKGYDIYIFSGNWCHYAAKRHKPSLMYCHTPVRAFYDQRGPMIARLPRWKKPIAWAWAAIHSRFDRAAMRHMDVIMANSNNVKERVKKFYGRDSIVVYGPVATGKFRFEAVGDYWLSVNRFYPEKRVAMQVEIFRRLPDETLCIVGDTQGEETPRRVAAGLKLPPNVKLLGSVDQKTLGDLYARCKGFITTAVDEDMGLTPIEAMASGKAVLATNEGGYRETVVDRETGWLLPANVDAFVEKIKSLTPKDLEAMKGKCIARAKMFEEGPFIDRVRSVIDSMKHEETLMPKMA